MVATVAFDRKTAAPARVIQAVELPTHHIAWRRRLPSPSCCAFPVVAMTPRGWPIALGGAEQTTVYDSRGTSIFTAALDDGRLHSTVAMDREGLSLVVGQWEGTVAAFAVGRGRLWVRRFGANVFAVAVSGRGGVAAAALRNRLVLLRLRDGAVLRAIPYDSSRTGAVAVSEIGDRVGLVRKREDGWMVVEVFSAGRRSWKRELGPGTVPLLQMDELGRWLAVGDLLGRQAAVFGPSGEVVWQAAGGARAAAAVAPDGRTYAAGAGSLVEIRALPSGRTVWRSRLPDAVHLLRLAGGRLAALGAADPEAGIPDRAWFARVPAVP